MPTVYKKPPSHPSGGAGEETMIRGHLADSGYSDGVYRGADGGGYVGRLRRGRGKEKGEQPFKALPRFLMLSYQAESL